MRRGGAVVGMALLLGLLPVGPASAQEILPLPSPSPSPEEPSPSPSPSPSPEPSPSPTAEPVRSPSPRSVPSPVVTSATASPTPSPSPAVGGLISTPGPLASTAAEEPVTEGVAATQVDAYVRWALALAALLGLAGGAGLYWTRSSP